MRVVVFGAGYAGITLARRLETGLPPEADLVVVDETGSHFVQHELHRLVRRPALADTFTVSLDELLDRATVRPLHVERFDVEDDRAVTADGEDLAYDYGAICVGAATASHGIPGVREHGTPLKRADDARQIRERFHDLCDDGGQVVVGGAGLSGIQVAGELAALARELECRERVEIVLVEQEDDVAPGFPRAFQSEIRDALVRQDIRLETGTTIERATEDHVELASGVLDADQFVWTGGITGRAAMGGERPRVSGDLRTTRSTFVLGDAARVVDVDGDAVPATAATAIKQARTTATNLVRLVEYDLDESVGFEPRLDPYHYTKAGWIVSIGDETVAKIGPSVLTGRTARAMKRTVGISHLSGIGAVDRVVRAVEDALGF